LVFMVNVGKYTIYGSYGVVIISPRLSGTSNEMKIGNFTPGTMEKLEPRLEMYIRKIGTFIITPHRNRIKVSGSFQTGIVEGFTIFRLGTCLKMVKDLSYQ